MLELKLSASVDPTHPNKHPFVIKLFPVDTPSDFAPTGTGGKRVMVSSEVAKRDLHTLVGMALNASADLSEHDPTSKIGVIDKASVIDGWAVVEGYLFKYDAPETIAKLQAMSQAGLLGASFESTDTFGNIQDDVIVIDRLSFTGATAMLASKAAWTSTNVKAQRMNEDALPTEVDKALKAQAAEMAEVKENLKIMAQSNEQLTTSIGQLVEALKKEDTPMPTPVTPETPAGDVKAGAETVTPAAPDFAAMIKAAVEAATAELLTKFTSVETELAAVKAQAAKSPAVPQRRTLNSASLMAKHDIDADHADGESGVMKQIDGLLEKGMIDSNQSIAIKLDYLSKSNQAAV